MKIATFNVNSVRVRLPIVLDWLGGHQPDVLALQETKVTDDLFPAEAFRQIGYHAVFRGQKSYNGVALLTRTVPEQVSYGFDDGSESSRLMCAYVGGIWVVNTYVPQGRDIEHEMYATKLEWYRRLRTSFDRHFKPSDALVWLGDMNVAHDPIDVHNPDQRTKHVCYHADARAAFSFCRAWGFEDVFRKHHPESGHYTFYDYRQPDNVERGRGWRIDYILTSPSLAQRCLDAWIDCTPRGLVNPSDHVPMIARFD